ncbi:MAG: hypothetical protein U5K69_21785 [Balneolaceae bacterium]|nr:hypothetical protein [Balneolaceae bacterium]
MRNAVSGLNSHLNRSKYFGINQERNQGSTINITDKKIEGSYSKNFLCHPEPDIIMFDNDGEDGKFNSSKIL